MTNAVLLSDGQLTYILQEAIFTVGPAATDQELQLHAARQVMLATLHANNLSIPRKEPNNGPTQAL